MRKIWMVLLLAALLISACGQSGTATDAVGKTQETATNAPAAPDTAALPKGSEMECQVVSLSPTPGPTEASMFPPVTEEDWVLGDLTGPTLTIIEYSDFQ